MQTLCPHNKRPRVFSSDSDLGLRDTFKHSMQTLHNLYLKVTECVHFNHPCTYKNMDIVLSKKLTFKLMRIIILPCTTYSSLCIYDLA